ncbi:MAG: hypothetical protein Q9167_004550 [Letrouitia subvulpina]
MRYLNWDVLLFAQDSKAPLHEFKADCYVTRDVEPDKFGDGDGLCFPPFHWEILTQNYWNAGESFGRIKIVVAEGLSRNQESSPEFRQTRNVVSFSFQHAPLSKTVNRILSSPNSDQGIAVLEDAGIAYPNAVMWCQSTQPVRQFPEPCKTGATDPNVHTHSPHHESYPSRFTLQDPATIITPRRISQAMMPLSTRCNTSVRDPPWTKSVSMHDPFVENGRHQALHKWGTRASSSDQSMPDYSYSVTPRSSRNISLQDVQKVASVGTFQSQSQFEELMAALSPKKASGTYAPTNTRASSTADTPLTAVKPSVAAEARAASCHGQPHFSSATVQDMNPLAMLNPSDLNQKSLGPGQRSENVKPVHENVKQTPVKEIKSRKEGKSHNAGFTKPDQREVAVGSISRQTLYHSF